VKIVEKCIPQEKPVTENLADKENRINSIFEKDTKLLTYSEWILAERLKHQQTSGNGDPPAIAAVSSTMNREATPNIAVSRAVSAAQLSEQLAASPKEDEVWATDCAVCLAEFDQEEEVRELPCEHIFHHDCIHDWFMKAKAAACPLCRNLLHSGLSTDQISPRPEARASTETQTAIVPAPEPAAVEAV